LVGLRNAEPVEDEQGGEDEKRRTPTPIDFSKLHDHSLR
jgi:hypothetical protein